MIRLCSFFKPEVVGLLLEVNPRTVRRTWARFKATGEVASTNKGGRKKKLGDDEMEVSCNFPARDHSLSHWSFEVCSRALEEAG